jgi:epi-isozizaene 5-monooxygenase
MVAGARPVLGHAGRMLRDPLGFLESLGDHGDVVMIRLGRKTMYAVCTPDLVGELLTKRAQSTIIGGPLWETLEDLIGQGVATSNGAVHRRHRRLIQPAFRPERVANDATMMAEEAGAMVARWRPGHVIDVFEELFDFATRTVLGSMLSTRATGPPARYSDCPPRPTAASTGRSPPCTASWTRSSMSDVPAIPAPTIC